MDIINHIRKEVGSGLDGLRTAITERYSVTKMAIYLTYNSIHRRYIDAATLVLYLYMGQFYGMAAAWRRMGIINHILEKVGGGLVGLQVAVSQRCSVPNMANDVIANLEH